jgi:Electron transfer DM13
MRLLYSPTTGTSPGAVPAWVRFASAPAAALFIAAGIWLTGAVLTEEANLAKMLTGAFLGACALTALLVARRWRALAVPVLGTFLLVGGGLGGWLLLASSRDVVVREQVTVPVATDAQAPPAPSQPRPAAPQAAPPQAAPPQAAPPQPVAVGSGEFVSVAHTTTGSATLIDRPDGSRVLTLTDLMTSPGPDLRVYLVPGNGRSVDGAVDLGALKGNRGDQEYAVPATASSVRGAVVIWCRAFTVNFGHAALT